MRGGDLQWRYGFQGRTLRELRARIAELEAADLFNRTDRLARPEADPHERMDFARDWSALVDSGCRPAGFSDENSPKLRCEPEE